MFIIGIQLLVGDVAVMDDGSQDYDYLFCEWGAARRRSSGLILAATKNYMDLSGVCNIYICIYGVIV